MSLNNYTLDRFEGDYAIFLKRPEETEQIIIHQSEYSEQLFEGDIVTISYEDGVYHIKRLDEETTAQKNKIKQMMQALRNKRK
ncbi:DUF3006 domain-containing protein [Metasolibacillus meyeri]|uniref:DUF3006 domain-containing protein n=1 Tax=Metasolibacillus meyeri TaxID=1071052 RepID=A0AAW9NXF9_9BACL|nr:DUF3006 domain-containing protein [Metasolibacillus meyeri]MEC1180830.1 DUF3006 domain-containing protein [Metasolibacillus meyeri]